MRWLRSTWFRRVGTAVLAVGLLLLLALGPRTGTPLWAAAGDGDRTLRIDAYETWLRGHIPAAAGTEAASVERALEDARSDAPASLRAFVRAFAAAYQAQNVSGSLAALFAVPGVDGERLFDVLCARTTQMGQTVALPILTRATASPSTVSGRSADGPAALDVAPAAAGVRLAAAERPAVQRQGRRPLEVRWTHQPRGP
jgi:hypothetical protein